MGIQKIVTGVYHGILGWQRPDVFI